MIPERIANQIYDVLVTECDAPESLRSCFVAVCERDKPAMEYRFIGSLGFGGKFWHSYKSFYVNCYPEDETDERREAIRKANERLNLIYQSLAGPTPGGEGER